MQLIVELIETYDQIIVSIDFAKFDQHSLAGC